MAGKLNLGGKFSSLDNDPLGNAFDSMFGDTPPAGSGIEEIKTQHLKPFGYYDPERSMLHRFQPYPDEKMERLVEDIREQGVISPLIVRQRTATEYEILAGHNRHTAAIKAGLESVPCIVKNIDDDQAIIIMTTTNLNQRDELLPSEKAFAYREYMDAMKQQGKRTDLSLYQNDIKSRTDETLYQNDTRLRTDEILSASSGDSRIQIYRYMRLTKLIPPPA